MNDPNKRKPVWDSAKTRKLAQQMEADATAHEADATRREADGWHEGAEKATRWARMKRRAATLLHDSAEAAAQREARKDAQRYQLRDIDPGDLIPTGLGGSFPEVYECKACSKEVVVTEQIAVREAGDTDLNAAYRTVFSRGWRPIVPRGVICADCVTRTQDTGPPHPDLFD